MAGFDWDNIMAKIGEGIIIFFGIIGFIKVIVPIINV